MTKFIDFESVARQEAENIVKRLIPALPMIDDSGVVLVRDLLASRDPARALSALVGEASVVTLRAMKDRAQNERITAAFCETLNHLAVLIWERLNSGEERTVIRPYAGDAVVHRLRCEALGADIGGYGEDVVRERALRRSFTLIPVAEVKNAGGGGDDATTEEEIVSAFNEVALSRGCAVVLARQERKIAGMIIPVVLSPLQTPSRQMRGELRMISMLAPGESMPRNPNLVLLRAARHWTLRYALTNTVPVKAAHVSPATD